MKNAIVFGNCQAGEIARVLNATEAFASRYRAICHSVLEDEPDKAQWAEDVSDADVFFIQDIRNFQKYPFRAQARKRLGAKFAYTYFAALWPFDSHQNGPDPGANRQTEFSFHDVLLGRLRTEVPDPSSRFEAYKTLSGVAAPNLSRYAQAEAVRLRRQDKRLGLDIGEWVLDSYKDRRLFHTITHPTVELTVRVANALMSKAGVGAKVRLDDFDEDLMQHYQTPIHPVVIRSLGLRWANEDTLYNFHGRRVTFDEYVRLYIEAYG